MEKDLIYDEQEQCYRTELGEKVETIEEKNFMF